MEGQFYRNTRGPVVIRATSYFWGLVDHYDWLDSGDCDRTQIEIADEQEFVVDEIISLELGGV